MIGTQKETRQDLEIRLERLAVENEQLRGAWTDLKEATRFFAVAVTSDGANPRAVALAEALGAVLKGIADIEKSRGIA